MPHRFATRVDPTVCLLVVLLSGWATVSNARAAETDDEGWNKLYEKEGITGWRRSHPDTKLYEWRGEGFVDADFYRVVAVYMDSNRSDEWVADCVESIEVHKPDIDTQITYNRTHLPRPFWDRDFVWEDVFVFDPETRSVVDTMTSLEHLDYPERDDVVRGELLSSSFYARWDAPERTFVEVRIHVDPKGRLPAWLVNAVSRSWPFVTFRDLREQIYEAEGYEKLEQAIREAHPMVPPDGE